MDSYFGEIGHSFYGGPNGQSFSIKEVFPNRVALENDKILDFTSSVQVGEYVIISYGNPNSDLTYYNQNKAIDAEAYNGQTFNATLWQKQVTVNGEISYGEPIVTFTTSVPNFIFSSKSIAPGAYNNGNFYAVNIGEKSYSNSQCTEDETLVNQALEVENYNEEYDSWEIKDITPSRYVKNTSVFKTTIVEKISSNEINKQYEIKISDPWNFQIGEVTSSNPGVDPTVNITDNANDKKYLNFTLPKPWNINITKGSDLAANASPKLTPLSDTETAKQWSLQLPVPWGFELGADSDTSEKVAVDPGVLPDVVINGYETTGQGTESNITKYIHFKLPKAWNIALGSDSGRVNPVNFASVSMDNDGPAPDTTKYVHIKIPDAWNIALGADSDTGEKVAVNPGTLPSVVIDRQTTAGQGQESNNTKYIHFKLPKAWEFAVNEVELINPNTTPEVTINASSDTKYLHFKLPVAQYFTTTAFSVVALGPTETPSARTWFNGGDTINRYPKVELSLPRAAKTTYGNAVATYNVNIGEDITVSSSGTTRSDYIILSELEVGDFYINTTYAKVYEIKTKISESGTITATYRGSMQLAIPTISGNPVNPYDANGNPVVPTVATSAIGPVSSWNVNVDVIKAPVFKKSADSGFVASTAQGVISSVAANDGVTYTIKIPKGTKITTQSEVPDRGTLVGTAMDGDLYFDNNGWIYRFDGITGNSWVRGATIHGNDFVIRNKGESQTINITASDLTPYSLEPTLIQKMGAYILDTYPSYNNLKENEILNIVYSPEPGVSIAYWLYKGANEWGGDQVTGTVSSAIIENTWQIDDEDNKAYSVTLINSLRTTITQLTNRVTALENAMIKAWGELPIIE